MKCDLTQTGSTALAASIERRPVGHVIPQRRLWAEFSGLFLAAPILLALILPPSAMLPMLLVVTLIGIILLHRTPGFHWGELTQGRDQIGWRVLTAFSAITGAVSLLLVWLVIPEAFLILYRTSPPAWVVVMLLYPVLSALPQELLFRPLFFRRYAPILPRGHAAILLNAAVFSLAHLLYWNWIVAVMTFVGGLVFAWAYQTRRSFTLAVVLHAIAGNILFTIGAGMLFYTGTVVRPF